jgi:hypothetical protein
MASPDASANVDYFINYDLPATTREMSLAMQVLLICLWSVNTMH